MFRKILFSLAMLCILGFVDCARGSDVYYYLPLNKLDITKGKLPEGGSRDPAARYLRGRQRRNFENLMQPYAVSNSEEEIYLFVEAERDQHRWLIRQSISQNIADTFIAIRATGETDCSGRLFLPKPDFSGMAAVDFSASAPAGDQETARRNFLRAKQAHFQHLRDRDIPGSAWFRHNEQNARHALTEASGDGPGDSNIAPVERQRRWRRESELQQTYSLFSGGRAISENLQLDRQLRAVSPGDRTIDIGSISGITTRWSGGW